MNLKDIKDILHILSEQDFQEFELEQEGVKLRVRKAPPVAPPAPPVPTPAVLAPMMPAMLPGVGSYAAAPLPPLAPGAAGTPSPVPPASPAEPAAEDEGIVLIKSPIVGTFYRSPAPNAAAYVSVGDRIKVGQVLCIVEAMKLMNEIEAETGGEIVKIHRESGQPVQFGDPLFSVRVER